MTDSHNADVSVIIGFKDWGRERVLIAMKTLRGAFGHLNGEIIVSDYGSTEPGRESFADDVVRAGGRYVFTETDGTWSRSRALNAGFAVATGRVLISTDADMLFGEGSLGIVSQRILDDPRSAVVLQCRDLPEGAVPDDFDGTDVDWSALEQASRLRPRWGMGGMMACSREAFERVRGLDERMVIYGGEDIDFANRLRRAGCRLEWSLDEGVRMYHMWHTPTRSKVSADVDGAAAIEENRRIHLHDKSYVRNTTRWRHSPRVVQPPVSVVVSTHNRAGYLPDAIDSILAQTVSDFELIIVDDGSTDGTRDLVAGYDDERIRYFYRDQSGLAAARNFAAEQSRGTFTVIHDDDDIMLPWRIESHLEALAGSLGGTYGAWVDFDDVDGRLSPHLGKELTLGSLLFSGKVYLHPTLMVNTEMLRRIRYDETLRSGSDYNLGIRLLRSGLKFAHTGDFHILRRLHPRQVTSTDGERQKVSATLSTFMARTPMSHEDVKRLRAAQKSASKPTVRGSSNVAERVAAYLPDHLVRRHGVVAMDEVSQAVTGVGEWLRGLATDYARVELVNGGVERETAYFENLTWKRLAQLASSGIRPSIHVERLAEPGPRPAAVGQGGVVSKWVSMVLESSSAGDSPYAYHVSASRTWVEKLSPQLRDGRLTERLVIDGERTLYVALLASQDLGDLSSFLKAGSADPGLVHNGAWVPSTIATGHAVEQLARKGSV